jgi:prepilin-type N-terminal cleavage/methylation domain-containing protein
MIRNHKGFTLIELMAVLLVLGIIAAIAIPRYMDLIRETRAANAVADLHTVRVASYMYFGDHGRWPPESSLGSVPEGLTPYLPPRFRFRGTYYNLDWENWLLPDGTARFPATNIGVGISVSTNDKKLADAIRDFMRTDALIKTQGRSYTLQIEGTSSFGKGGLTIP